MIMRIITLNAVWKISSDCYTFEKKSNLVINKKKRYAIFTCSFRRDR